MIAQLAIPMPAQPRRVKPGKGRKPGTAWTWSPSGITIEEWERRVIAAVRRLGKKARPGIIASALKVHPVRLAPTIEKLVDGNILCKLKSPNGRRHLVVCGSDLDPNARDHNDTELNDALTICRRDGDLIEKLGKDHWRVNARETLDREGLIARGERIAKKRQLLGASA